MKSTFQSRVKRALKDGDLTVADLQSWFGRPYPTVWRWINSGWEPRGPDGRRAERDLDRLERIIARGSVFPIPTFIGSRNRRGYIRDAYHAEHGRLPQTRPAK